MIRITGTNSSRNDNVEGVSIVVFFFFLINIIFSII